MVVCGKKYSISFMLSPSNIKKYKNTTSFIVSSMIFDGPGVDYLNMKVYYEVQDIMVVTDTPGCYQTFSNYAELQSKFTSDAYTMWYGTAVVDNIQRYIGLKSITINNTIRAKTNPKFFLNDRVLCGSVTTTILATRFARKSGYEYILQLDINKATVYGGSKWCPENILRDIHHFNTKHK